MHELDIRPAVTLARVPPVRRRLVVALASSVEAPPYRPSGTAVALLALVAVGALLFM